MNNTNQTEKIQKRIILTLILGIIAIGLIGFYAFSKYITSIEGQGEAQIAKWSFKIKDGETSSEGPITFAITRTDGYGNVATGLLAPGTSGELPIIVDTRGTETHLTYDLVITITNFPKNILLYDSSKSLIRPTIEGDGTVESPRKATIKISRFVPHTITDADREHDETITWNWPYETTTGNGITENDAIDTEDSGKEVIVTISAIGTEVLMEPVNIEEIEVGDIIKYSPQGETYIWETKYATSDNEEPIELKSGKNEDYNIDKWQVLSVNKISGEIKMVPIAPVGELAFQGAQGYNNAVKLLNAACDKLYSDKIKGIEARSIRIEDFEDLGEEKSAELKEKGESDWETAKNEYKSNYAMYGNQRDTGGAYGINYSYYPKIYEDEKLKVIDEIERGTGTRTGLGVSKQEDWVEKTDVKDQKRINGYKQAESSIYPYQTFYTFGTDAAGASNTEKYLGSDVYNLLFKDLSNNNISYWMASRCIGLRYSNYCYFCIHTVDSGGLNNGQVFFSNNTEKSTSSRGLFPVVSLSYKNLVEGEGDGIAYEVE